MAIEVYLSSYVPKVRQEACEMVRCLGRRTQRPLWVRSDAALDDMIYFDSGGMPITLTANLRSRGAAYLEYQLFPQGQEPIYLLSPFFEGDRGMALFTSKDEEARRLAMRCVFLEKAAGTVLMVGAKDIRLSRRYTGLLSDIKTLLGRDAAVERGAAVLGEPAALGEYRVILSDAFSSEAVFRCLLYQYPGCPKILHIGCRDGNVYTLCDEEKSACFSPSKATLSSAVFCFYAWLKDRGEISAANRLRVAVEGCLGESTSFSDVTAHIKKRIDRVRRSDNNMVEHREF